MNTSARRYELDWLRVMAILAVFFYHSTRFFDLWGWHVKNVNNYVGVEIWNSFMTMWMMPLFFVISGASLYYALKKSTGWKQFYVSKFSRLMIPVILASFTHSMVQIYLERVSHNQFSGSFWAFIPKYFSGLYLHLGGLGNFAFHGMYLWYLLFLFFYSLLCYRLFVWLLGKGSAFLNRITNLLSSGLMYLLLPLPLLLTLLVVPQSVLNAGNGGWAFVYYLWFLIAGFVIVSNDGLLDIIKKKRNISLAIAIILSGFYLFQVFSLSSISLPGVIRPWLPVVVRFFSSWCWLLAILGFGMRYLAFDRPILRHLNEGVLPFYILHQTVLLSIGYFIMPLDIQDFVKWVIVFIDSFAAIIALYFYVIRKVDVLRFLFGMKTSKPLFSEKGKRNVLAAFHVIYIGLIAFAIANPSAGALNRSPAPIKFDKERDVILDTRSIAAKSGTGIQLVKDGGGVSGQAIAFIDAASPSPLANPAAYVDLKFDAPAGRYVVWLRGKCDTDSISSDSVWIQTDKRIGTNRGGMFGNWLDVHPPGTWAWASNGAEPNFILLLHSGTHTMRIQPRQVPHQIDQIWLSRFQNRIPDTEGPIK